MEGLESYPMQRHPGLGSTSHLVPSSLRDAIAHWTCDL